MAMSARRFNADARVHLHTIDQSEFPNYPITQLLNYQIHRPVHSGLSLARNAVTPSRKSSLV